MLLLFRLMELVTGQPRYFPEIIWSKDSWVHNMFRCYEMLFGRRCGIRAEISSSFVDGQVSYTAHSFEGACALVETFIRSAFKDFRLPVKIYITRPVAAMGFALPSLPFYFSILFDASGSAAVNTASWSHTCTGSNGAIFMGINSSTLSGVTYNTVTANLINTATPSGSNTSYLYGLTGPATGAHTVTASGGTANYRAGSTSYSGVDPTQPDSTSGNTTLNSTITLTTTVVAANCWLIVMGGVGGSGATGSTNKTDRVVISVGSFAGMIIADTNAAVGTGAQSVVLNSSVSGNMGGVIASIKPFAPPVVPTRRMFPGIAR